MKNKTFTEEWLRRAESNFAIAKKGKKISSKVTYDDLCFECQQAAEKSLKAILVSIDRPFDRTHFLERLFELLKNAGIDIPPVIEESSFLSEYATVSRYPGNYDPADNKDYKSAIKAAEKVLKWAKSIIEKKPGKLF